MPPNTSKTRRKHSPELFHRSVPLHHQIERLLRAKIESEQWKSGDRIPNELQLADQFNVSRTTIRQAMQSLNLDELITRRRSSGTFVSSARSARKPATTIKSLLMGYEAKVRVIEAGAISAPSHVAEFLCVARGQPVQRFIRVEYADGVPFAVLFNYMHPNLGRRIARSDLSKNSMLECLLALKVEFGNVRHSIQARMPDEEVAILLQIDLTEPTLFWQEQMFDASNRPLHLCDMYYRADRCRYEIEAPFERIRDQTWLRIPGKLLREKHPRLGKKATQ